MPGIMCIYKATLALLGAVALLAFTGCDRSDEQRELQFFPDMYRNPAVKAQEEYTFFRTGLGSLVPPEGTLPRGFTPYPYDITEGALAGEELKNPLPMTREVLETGQKYYNIHCIVCHGAVGAGDGLSTVIHRENGMPVPPSLYSEKIRNEWKDGQLYHTITAGQGQMPAYGARIDPMHRWAIVNYMRALGEASAPSEEDLSTVERLGWNAKEMDSPIIEGSPDELPKKMGEKQSVFRLDLD